MANNLLHKKTVGIIGLGYVGLPLLINFSKKFNVIGFDSDNDKVEKINNGISGISHISNDELKEIKSNDLATADISRISEVDAIIICVPTPITKYKEPDLSYIKNVMKSIAPHVKKGQLLSLESTTYPGTTEEIIYGTLNALGFEAGKDIFITYSPEREDPGSGFPMEDIPKVMGGITKECTRVGESFYSKVFKEIVEVESVKVAELSKLLENIHRAVNLGMINEFKMISEVLDVDPFDVISASATKPFGFVPYYPGPGWGGHCIPVDPFYLSWKVKEYGVSARFIELAGQMNDLTQDYVIKKIGECLDEKNKSVKNSKILLLGLSYKPDVDDARESPSLKLYSYLNARECNVDYSDPYFDTFPKTRNYNFDAKNIPLTSENLKSYDLVVILTAHKKFNFDQVHKYSSMILDTRGVYKADKKKVFRG
jgi:UDP-N-acetyl-D-glucosamine dehydrogenase